MNLYVRKPIRVSVIMLVMICLIPVYTKSGQKGSPFAVRSGGDAKRLIAELEAKLEAATIRQIKLVEQESGETFKPNKQLQQRQEEARKVIDTEVLPLLTRKVQTTTDENKPARMRVIDIDKIGKLSAKQLSNVLEDLAFALSMLPPLPGQASVWAKLIAPLLSFDEATKEKMSKLVEKWFRILLDNQEDVEELARISEGKGGQQDEQVAQVRKGYEEYHDNASQLLYPWVQVVSLLDTKDPLGLWLQYATTNSESLQTTLKQLISVAQKALEKAGDESPTEAQARGFILFAIASILAPEKLFKELASKGD